MAGLQHGQNFRRAESLGNGNQIDLGRIAVGAPCRRSDFRLRLGETLSDVAIRFNTTVEELLALNPGIEPTNLNVGQRIRVR